MQDRRLSTQLALTTILSETESFDEALPRILKDLCGSLEMDRAEYWQATADRNKLSLFASRILGDDAALARFEAESRKIEFAGGQGLPGEILLSGDPRWMESIRDNPRFVRSSLAESAGLVTGCGFPVKYLDTTVGVFTLFSRHSLAGDYELMEALGLMGRQIGQFIERMRFREELKTSQRMVSVGTLATGIAHEINNPLSFALVSLESVGDSIRSLLESAGSGSLEPDELRARLGELLQPISDGCAGITRVKQIVKNLKIFARTSEPGSNAVSLQSILEFSIKIVWHEIRHRARLVRDFESDALVAANESALGQVFVNLLINAAQAISSGTIEENEIRVRLRRAGNAKIMVEVHDTGRGIPKEHFGRLFDPFFTTKPVGEGTGLGLPICQTTIQGLGGEIQVASEVGEGTTFRVILPEVRKLKAAAGPARAEMPAASSARILIIDDEPLLCETITRLLSRQYACSSTIRTTEALKRIEAGERFDLVICDLMMPEMTGMDLHESLRRIAPDQAERMLFITGGGFTARATEFIRQHSESILEKPFTSAEIRDRVSLALQALEQGNPLAHPV